MLTRLAVLLPTVLFGVTCWLGIAQGSVEDWRTESRYLAHSLGGQLEDLKARMQAVPEEDWSLADMQKYLQLTLRMVCSGKVAANYVRDQDLTQTSDLVSLVDRGYLPYWPDNPFNDWKPVEVRSVHDSFSPGDLVFQECPQAYYSGSRRGDRWPQSFALFIYGPDPEFASLGEIKVSPQREYAQWVTVPSGAMYNLIFYVESAAQVQGRYDRREAEKARKQQETQEDNNNEK